MSAADGFTYAPKTRGTDTMLSMAILLKHFYQLINCWLTNWCNASQCIWKTEGHSVERIYLRQRSSDGSVNKTILKPRLAIAATNRYTWDFSDVKFRVAAQLAGSL